MAIRFFFLDIHGLPPEGLETPGEIGKVLEWVQPGRDIPLISLEISNVLKIMLGNSIPQIFLRQSMQVSVTGYHDLYDVAILFSSKIVVTFSLIMNNHEDEWILRFLMNLSDVLLDNFLMLGSFEWVNHEDVEQWVHAFKNVFLDQAMTIGHWHKHWLFEVVVELYLYAAIVYKRFRMSLEVAIKHIVCERGASLRGLVRVGWHLEG